MAWQRCYFGRERVSSFAASGRDWARARRRRRSGGAGERARWWCGAMGHRFARAGALSQGDDSDSGRHLAICLQRRLTSRLLLIRIQRWLASRRLPSSRRCVWGRKSARRCVCIELLNRQVERAVSRRLTCWWRSAYDWNRLVLSGGLASCNTLANKARAASQSWPHSLLSARATRTVDATYSQPRAATSCAPLNADDASTPHTKRASILPPWPRSRRWKP